MNDTLFFVVKYGLDISICFIFLTLAKVIIVMKEY